jgi:hypothetical protein
VAVGAEVTPRPDREHGNDVVSIAVLVILVLIACAGVLMLTKPWEMVP